MWTLIKKPFKSSEDKNIINELEKNPTNERFQGKVEIRLAQLLKEYPDIAKELENYIIKNSEKTNNTQYNQENSGGNNQQGNGNTQNITTINYQGGSNEPKKS